jgi:hypothetical protein
MNSCEEFDVGVWRDECEARRQAIVDSVDAAETMLDAEFGDSRPDNFWFFAEGLLQFDHQVWSEDGSIEDEEWRSSWQLGYWRIGDRWRFVLYDESVPTDLEGLIKGEIPLIDASNAALLYFGRRIKTYTAQVRDFLNHVLRKKIAPSDRSHDRSEPAGDDR